MSAGARPMVMLLSGGMDSATALSWARTEGFVPVALSFRYGQRHDAELEAARRLAQKTDCELIEMNLDLGRFGASALTDPGIAVPEGPEEGIPVTYVPARNIVFLSVALALAEARGIHDLCIGVNAVDYSGYPDCRREFITAFENMANRGTREGIEGRSFRVHAPLIDWTKEKIIRVGTRLGIDYSMTVSCYRADSRGWACGTCEACRLRRQGFEKAGIEDPTLYV